MLVMWIIRVAISDRNLQKGSVEFIFSWDDGWRRAYKKTEEITFFTCLEQIREWLESELIFIRITNNNEL